MAKQIPTITLAPHASIERRQTCFNAKATTGNINPSLDLHEGTRT